MINYINNIKPKKISNVAFAAIGVIGITSAIYALNKMGSSIGAQILNDGLDSKIDNLKLIKTSLTGLDEMQEHVLNSFNKIPVVIRTKKFISDKSIKIFKHEAELALRGTAHITGQDYIILKNKIKDNINYIKSTKEKTNNAVLKIEQHFSSIPKKTILSVQERIINIRKKHQSTIKTSKKII